MMGVAIQSTQMAYGMGKNGSQLAAIPHCCWLREKGRHENYSWKGEEDLVTLISPVSICLKDSMVLPFLISCNNWWGEKESLECVCIVIKNQLKAEQ